MLTVANRVDTPTLTPVNSPEGNLPEKYQDLKVEFSCNVKTGDSAMKKSKFSDIQIIVR